jgi:DNA-binding beta-propeller fold protein YncE
VKASGLVLVCVALSLSASPAGGASAARGELRQLSGAGGCVTSAARPPCAPGRGLELASGIAVSPDGKNVYVASSGAQGGVAIFRRNAGEGTLSQLAGTTGCVSAAGSGGKCARGRGLRLAQAVVVSPDGKAVYVLGSDVAVFARDASTGALAQLDGSSGCIGSSAGCSSARGFVAGQLGALAVSADGRNVYVASHRIRTSSADGAFDEGAVAAFSRNAASGALTQLGGRAGCVADGAFAGCGKASPLGTLTSIAVSPDGRNLYVGSQVNSEDNPKPDAVLTFDRASSGALSRSGCVSRTARAGCGVDAALFSPTAVAVSPDGKSVYATALETAAVAFFSRGAGGRLRPAGCIGPSFASCARENRDLAGPSSLAVGRDGRSVYVAWKGSGVPGTSAVGAFERAADGRLAFLPGKSGCVGEPKLTATCSVGRGLGGASAVALSPDGKHLYVAAFRAGVAVFSRE